MLMINLVLGANTVLDSQQCRVGLQSPREFGKQIGAVWLPLNASNQVVTSPSYLHEPKAWANLTSSDSHQSDANATASQPQTNDTNPSNNHCQYTWQLDLDNIFKQHAANKLFLIVYCYDTPGMIVPAVELNDVQLSINDSIHYHFNTTERHIKSSKVLEIYQRNGQYKCRALAENSQNTLNLLAEKLDISLDARHPQAQPSASHATDATNTRPRPRPGEKWTGTAFAIDPYHLLTCEHITDGASIIGLRQQGQPDIEAQVVISDYGSDTALLKVERPLTDYLPIRRYDYDMLGEEITTLGFPMSGLSSQLQVTQGCIAGLQGIKNDIRFLQFTAPIQPGSSGSPLILATGEVVGMVMSSIENEKIQNMNFAVKHQLLSAIIASAGLNLVDSTNMNNFDIPSETLSTPQLTKKCKSAIWMVGCQA